MNFEIALVAKVCIMNLKTLKKSIGDIPDDKKICSDWMIAGKAEDMIGNLEGYLGKESNEKK